MNLWSQTVGWTPKMALLPAEKGIVLPLSDPYQLEALADQEKLVDQDLHRARPDQEVQDTVPHQGEEIDGTDVDNGPEARPGEQDHRVGDPLVKNEDEDREQEEGPQDGGVGGLKTGLEERNARSVETGDARAFRDRCRLRHVLARRLTAPGHGVPDGASASIADARSQARPGSGSRRQPSSIFGGATLLP